MLITSGRERLSVYQLINQPI